MDVTDEIRGLLGAGTRAYFGEPVSTREHALQAAYFAGRASAAPALVAAALLHDVGHLLDAAADDIAQWTTDARHEQVGGAWLAARFPAAVSEPVRLHVPAKRYLCATDARYVSRLSAASLKTLRLQGGPMTAREVAQFERLPHHRAALQIRRWDDAAKVAALEVPGFEHYAALLGGLAR